MAGYTRAVGTADERFDSFLKAWSNDIVGDFVSGTVDHPHGWNGLGTIGSTDLEWYSREFGEDVSDFPIGVYIIQILDSGIVWGYRYSSFEAAKRDFDEVAHDHTIFDTSDIEHSDYPHEPGRLHDCPACESRCHCTEGNAECIFDGEHNGLAEAEMLNCLYCGTTFAARKGYGNFDTEACANAAKEN